ncbi:hypothetical protein D3C76_403850 [compost metagenome]
MGKNQTSKWNLGQTFYVPGKNEHTPGKFFTVVAQDGNTIVGIQNLTESDTCFIPTAVGFSPKAIQPLVTDVFKVGDRVKSRHTFEGVVTGYEEETNRVIVISDRIDEYIDRDGPGSGTRVRYSYKIHDLIVNNFQDLELIPNRKYYIQEKNGLNVKVRAMYDTVFGQVFIGLVREDNGKLFMPFSADHTITQNTLDALGWKKITPAQ